jgi:hypothetical protein
MTQKSKDLPDFAQIASDMVAATQVATMRMLEAELHAFAQISGAEQVVSTIAPTEAEVEDGFDNMPV